MKTLKQLKEKSRCWTGYKPVPGKKPYSPGSCAKEEVELNKKKDEEYSDPYMAVNQLKTIMHNAQEMIDLIGEKTDLPEWVESKITLAEDYIMTVANYMRSELKEEIEQIEELSKETLISYRDKAKATANKMSAKHHEIAKKDMATGDFTASKKSHSKIAKLDKGYLKAGQKIAKKASDEYHSATQGPKKPSNQFKTPPQGYKAPGSDRPYWGEDVDQDEDSYLVEYLENPEEMFDIIEELVMEIAEFNNIDPEIIWEDLEDMSDEELYESAAWRRKEGKDPKGGLNRKGVASYRRENPGSKLKMAVTTPPSKLKKGSKAANRRKSFCARMGGMKGPMRKNGKPTRKALALRKWNC
jgi:hypothetical protein